MTPEQNQLRATEQRLAWSSGDKFVAVLRTFVGKHRGQTALAICSGNHDAVGREITSDRAPVFEWLAELSKHRNFISD